MRIAQVEGQAARPTAGLYVPDGDGDRARFVLERTDVDARVSGNLARVEVTQTFSNPFEEPLEAVYVFPLPDEAAVDDMEIRIGDRVIKGDIRDREEAREIYDRAREEGRTAGLLEQERANIFTQSLANLLPGEEIQVTIRYTDVLKFDGGDYEFVFPLVVGPRYVPGNPIGPDGDTDRVPDGSRINPPVLPPELRSGNDVFLNVALDAGLPLGQVRSPSHDIRSDRDGDRLTVSLRNGDRIANKDFILRYRVAGAETQATVLSQSDERGGHFGLYLIPAIDYPERAIVSKDVVFLMDTSGSQRGAPLAQSKALMRRFLEGLNPDDTFNIVDFASTATRLSPQPLANTATNRQRALAYIDALDANGGTNLMQGLNSVLAFPPAPSGRLRSIVLLTDGYIGNDVEVVGEVRRRLQPGNRFYSFGVGSSPNRFLLNRLAEVGRGAARVVRHDEPIEPAVETFFRRINNPVLTEIQVRWEGDGPAPDLYPNPLPDLFDAQPLVLFGRKADGRGGTLVVTGTLAGGDRYEQRLPVTFQQAETLAIAQLWGRHRIKDLMVQMAGGEVKSLVDAVTQTALDYRLLSRYTAFVAASEEVRTDPDGQTRRVQVPVELPEGVSFEGIFGDRAASGPESFAGRGPGGSITLSSGGGVRGGPEMLSPSPLYEEGNVRPDADIAPEPLPSPVAVAIARADGLDAAAIAELQDFLSQANLPAGFDGTVTVELTLREGRVVRIVLDDRASEIQEPAFVEALRRALFRWSAPADLRQLRLELQVENAPA